MPSTNVRLVLVVAGFTGLVWLTEYQIKDRVEFGVGVLTGALAVVLTAGILSLMDW